jgi:hypothetical protein
MNQVFAVFGKGETLVDQEVETRSRSASRREPAGLQRADAIRKEPRTAASCSRIPTGTRWRRK